jgi:peptide/nickel transport system permease protein
MDCLIRASDTGENMSLRLQKIMLQLKSFTNLMKKIFKNKKATAGLIMLLFFAFLAIFGPVFVTDDPINPGSSGIGRMPLAVVSAFPGWYRDFTGSQNYTTNLYVTSNAMFSDPNGLKKWQNSTTSNGITVSYNSKEGPFAKGCMQMNFTEAGNATIETQFYYPYTIPPSEYATELYYSVKTQNQTGPIGSLTIYAFITRQLALGKKVFPATTNITLPVSDTGFALIPFYQISSVNNDLFFLYGRDPDGVIFQNPGPYSLELVVQFAGNATASGNPTVLLSNVNLLLYGNSFGLLGSDDKGRDLFTQLIAGTQISFILGLVTAIVSVGIGLIVGLVAGYIGGATDEVLMRINDMLLVIPTLPLIIVLIFVVGQSLLNLIIVIGFLGWMGFARTVRSAILSLKERSFIEAVRSAGGGRFYIIRKHLIPNVFPLIYITLAMSVPGAIVTEAALSFLGLGPQDVMSWGRILYEYEAAGNIATGAFTTWYWAIPPGICIALLSLSFILIGFALDEILNPRLRER